LAILADTPFRFAAHRANAALLKEHCVELVDDIPLEQQRNDADDDGISPLSGLGDLSVTQSRYARVHDPVQRIQLALIREHDLPEGCAVKAAILVQDVLAPAFYDVPEGLRVGFNRFTRKQIRVDHRCAAVGEHCCNLRFSAGDVSCQSNANHLSKDLR